MIPEIGHYALILGLALALIGTVLPLYGAHRGDDRLIAMAPNLAIGQFLMVLTAFAALMWSFVVSDFSVLNVAINSHTAKPLLYKISGVWGNHEGSLVLWVLILTLFAAAIGVFGGTLSPAFRARVLSVQSMISSGFLLFVLFTSNPFLRIPTPPLQGNGLNPLLQDPGLAFHPPVLYLGYVGLSIAFSFAIAALIEGHVSAAWARWVRPWTLIAWSFLTAGIALGSWWAYYELGWGGWWFWDPVENASLMPWLAATALLHSVIVLEKRNTLKAWTILLAILAFSLSLLGTFLVRSGVLTSVHAFAVDPSRGIFILAFLTLVIGGSFTLFAFRASSMKSGGHFDPLSREGGLVLNNLLLVTALATVFVGTLYPLFLDALTGQKLSVGPPFYEATFMPLFLPLIIFMGLVPFMAWKRSRLQRIKRPAVQSVIFAVILALLVWTWHSTETFLAAFGIFLGTWLVAASTLHLFGRLKPRTLTVSSFIRRVVKLPGSDYGMFLAHVGMGITILGMTLSEAMTSEQLTFIDPGDSVEVADFTFRFDGVDVAAGSNYTSLVGRFDVYRGERFVKTLFAESRTYSSPPMQTTEAAIHSMVSGDLYAVIGDPGASGSWSARLYFKPLVSWIWVGAMIMMLGGMFSVLDRREIRIKSVRRTTMPAKPHPAE